MNKSMYSLILTDEVIARIDRLAYEKGMNRSQLIDHLLAKEVGMHTREHQDTYHHLLHRIADQHAGILPAWPYGPRQYGSGYICEI